MNVLKKVVNYIIVKFIQLKESILKWFTSPLSKVSPDIKEISHFLGQYAELSHFEVLSCQGLDFKYHGTYSFFSREQVKTKHYGKRPVQNVEVVKVRLKVYQPKLKMQGHLFESEFVTELNFSRVDKNTMLEYINPRVRGELLTALNTFIIQES